MDEKLAKAIDLLKRVEDAVEEIPGDLNFWRECYEFTGRHMILTDEGWQPGECKVDLIEEYGENCVSDEVNAPNVVPPDIRNLTSGVTALV